MYTCARTDKWRRRRRSRHGDGREVAGEGAVEPSETMGARVVDVAEAAAQWREIGFSMTARRCARRSRCNGKNRPSLWPRAHARYRLDARTHAREHRRAGRRRSARVRGLASERSGCGGRAFPRRPVAARDGGWAGTTPTTGARDDGGRPMGGGRGGVGARRNRLLYRTGPTGCTPARRATSLGRFIARSSVERCVSSVRTYRGPPSLVLPFIVIYLISNFFCFFFFLLSFPRSLPLFASVRLFARAPSIHRDAATRPTNLYITT